MGKKSDDRMTFSQNFICGGIAGVTSRSLTSPLDVVKIIAQVGSADADGFIGTFRNIFRNEGVKAFWKGNGIACVRLFPYSAIQFAAFNKFKVLMADPETGKLSASKALMAGATAGIIATTAVYPTDMVKTRLTVQHGGDPAKAKYKGIVHAFKVIAKEEGMGAFYKGLAPSILGVIPFAGGTFMAYEVLGHVWGKPKSELGPMEQFLNGCMAGAFAQTFSFPFDTIRKKMQAQARGAAGVVKTDVQFDGMLDCFRQTVKKNGIMGMWKGTTANLAKVAPYAGLMFLAFEASKRVFLFQNGYTKTMWSDEAKEGVPQNMKPGELKAYLAAKEE
eukprot:TRINITY_DN779947_c0_g1_i1.p1 TRINITY_DN779947_c0_g1~~TRINITY_DN779947_c0_g1_i1.p1  ORF type:complete len:333 (-),score=70.07 TRINITY_DN779947_c0_g1_i1:141-1139(-)